MQLKSRDLSQTKIEPHTAAINPSAKISAADVLMAAAMALPGLLAMPAQAENAPEGTTVAFKYLDYFDYQETDGTPANRRGGDRMRVKAPSLGITMGLGESWGLEVSGVYDSVSGASPDYHSAISTASIKDERKAGDAKLTRYFRRSSVGVGVAFSTEHDYESKAISADYRMSSEDNNQTYAFGLGYSSDKIQDLYDKVITNYGKPGKKRGVDLMVGITSNLSPTDIVQSNITYTDGKGFFDDPYKSFDKRPDNRKDMAWLTRYNHYFSDADAALHLSYRFFRNNWGMRSHTIESEWHQQLGGGWKIVPGLRFYSQNSADFYNDLGPGNVASRFAVPYEQRPFNSFDSRLSAFGAITPGVKLVWEISKAVTVDAKAELYKQKASYRIGGEGSPNNEPLTARFLQFGAAWHF
ncbi:MAG: DUF3570 domain-containing protein [Burkholderiales bacterium]